MPDAAAGIKTASSVTLAAGGGALVPAGSNVSYRGEGGSDSAGFILVRLHNLVAEGPAASPPAAR
jgi:hypothetical protein